LEIKPAQFAKMAGVTRQNISEKIKQKTLIVNAAGHIDTDHPVNAAYLSERCRKERDSAEVNQRKKQETRTQNSVTTDSVNWSDEDIAIAAGVPEELLNLTLRQVVMRYNGLVSLEKHAKILRDLMVAAEKELKMQERSLAFIKKDFVTSRIFQFINVLMKQLLEYPDSEADEIIAVAKSQDENARSHIIARMKEGLGKVIAGSKEHIISELESLKEKYSVNNNSIDRITEAISEGIAEAKENAE
jgi:hypothetical protein